MGELAQFGVLFYLQLDDLRAQIKECEAAGHHQQVAYSTYHDALTQVCWTDRRVRTTSHDLYAEAQPEFGEV